MHTLTFHYVPLQTLKKIGMVLLGAMGMLISVLLIEFEPISYFTNSGSVNSGSWQKKPEQPRVRILMPLANAEVGAEKIPVDKIGPVAGVEEKNELSVVEKNEPSTPVTDNSAALNVDPLKNQTIPVDKSNSVSDIEIKIPETDIEKTNKKVTDIRHLYAVNAGENFLKLNSLRNADIIKELSVTKEMYEFHFKTGIARLEQNAVMDKLDITIQKYMQAPETWSKIIILGFTDNRGSKLTNVKLGMKRAEQIKYLLVKSGIPLEKITVASFGPELPIRSNINDEGRAHNRRVEVNLLGYGG
jgi:outer membrane protein OmpA-like peptidoglycan-associated protein